MRWSAVSVRTLVLSALVALSASVQSHAHPKSAPPPLPKQIAPPPPQQPSTPAETTDKDGQPHFVTRVDLVSADVITRDNNGQFVADMKKEDFEVWEDGVKQDLVNRFGHVVRP